MIKRTQAQWRELFSSFAKSGLNASTFCQKKGLCPKYFNLRRKQLGEVKSKRSRKPRFDKVSIENSLTLGCECRIMLPNGVTVVMTGGEESGFEALLRSAMNLS